MADSRTELQDLLRRDFELEELPEGMSEQELLDTLADRIAWLLEYRLEYFFSLMYRLDVAEEKVDEALRPGGDEPANLALARLVVQRQKERLETRKKFRQ